MRFGTKHKKEGATVKGKRIRYFRCRKGITQKELGKLIGFPDDAADIRMTQYENERRNPKIERTNKIAEALDVSPYALMVPGIDTPIELIHTLFAIEDIYGLVVNEMSSNVELNAILKEWACKRILSANGEITRDEYDYWRYNFSKEDIKK